MFVYLEHVSSPNVHSDTNFNLLMMVVFFFFHTKKKGIINHFQFAVLLKLSQSQTHKERHPRQENIVNL